MTAYRPATASDAGAVAELHARSWRENYRGLFLDAFLDGDLPGERLRVWRERLEDAPGNQLVLLAVDGSELAGFVCVYGAHDPQWGSFVDNLHVAQAFQRQGVGAELMRRAGAWLASRHPGLGVHLLVLEANVRARRFYERMGGRSAEVATMETHGGAVVRSCRYAWARPELVETLDRKVARVVRERVAIVPYDPDWPRRFEQERDHLRSCLPTELIGRIEHFGSTAVPGLPAKPIVDLLVEVADLEEAKRRIVPVLEAQGYDYFWRASQGEHAPPFYAWFIKRDEHGVRSHHIHMVEPHFAHWDRLLFRDYLIQHPDVARAYAELKTRLAERHGGDRVAYTAAKSDFVASITARARESLGIRSST